MSLTSLLFSVPTLSLDGGGEMHAKAGSNVTLRCVIRNCLVEPRYSFWKDDIDF